ncbi:MAG TPA: aldehyde:ferredoxin oxidoreductase, partial [Firmicutes bacterium]|nr:aldehyde:ferredoxin oxidoreductase [Bacillota bacterium]
MTHTSVSGRLLRVDLARRTAQAEEIPARLHRLYLGARGLNTRRLLDEVPAGADPLGPENKLFFGVGPLNGTLFPGQR